MGGSNISVEPISHGSWLCVNKSKGGEGLRVPLRSCNPRSPAGCTSVYVVRVIGEQIEGQVEI